jgi:hypothetical protein
MAMALMDGRAQLWVKSGKAHGEQMFAASPPEADVATDIR